MSSHSPARRSPRLPQQSPALRAKTASREPLLRRLGRRALTIPSVVGLALLSVLAAPLWIPALGLVDLARGGDDFAKTRQARQ